MNSSPRESRLGNFKNVESILIVIFWPNQIYLELGKLLYFKVETFTDRKTF